VTTTFSNPHDVDAELDRIHRQPPDVPNWSENINLAVHSGHDTHGVYAHLSRMPGSSLWEGTLAVFLGDHEVLVTRSFGCPRSPDEASSGQLTWAVGEPLERWTLCFEGMARRLHRTAPAAGFVADGPTEPLRFELHVESAGSVWSLEQALGLPQTEQSFASLHLQQAVHVAGAVHTARGSFDVENVAVRDHSVGPRDYAGLLGDNWATCRFPDGRTLSILALWQAEGTPLISTGFVVENGDLVPVCDVEVTRLTSAIGDPRALALSFGIPAGRQTVELALQNSMVFSLLEPIGMPLGTDGSGLITVQGPARYSWNGMHALGWLERCNRLDRSPSEESG
jgi:hypothetical protein